MYNQLRLLSTLKLVQEIFVSFLITFALISAILYLTHSGYYSRLLFGCFSVIVFLLILVEKLASSALPRVKYSKVESVTVSSRVSVNPLPSKISTAPAPGLPFILFVFFISQRG